ncbi:hypothetical protein NKR23_g3638 [Pleurostoma richardsiae]|uniref:Uncharacterized protein n=1 Tax=Pleurostoma richardsiae TaxID=41990 RepID=A0AA38RXJ4_9PEZI|nr:hypothetical protein NKR23_g3638 [Pleurostoma richardsiae]
MAFSHFSLLFLVFLTHWVLADHELVPRDGHLEKRLSTDFSLEQTLVDEILFDGTSNLFGVLPIGVPPVTIKCARCCTKGDIVASLTDEEIFNPTLRFDLKGLQAFVELDVVTDGATTLTVPLFRSPPSPLGIDIPNGPKLGLTFEVNLIFAVAAMIDLHGGFFLDLPDGFFEADIINGTLSDLSFDGIMSKSLPLTVNNNGTTATFQVDLQLRAQIGIDTTSTLLPIFSDFGIGAEVGVFVNIVEFIAQLDSAPDCQLQATETFDVNVGAFLNADIEIGDGKTFGAVPTVSTTLFEAAIGTHSPKLHCGEHHFACFRCGLFRHGKPQRVV